MERGERIGVLLETDTAGLARLFEDKKWSDSLGRDVTVFTAPCWLVGEGEDDIAGLCRREKLDRVVLVGPPAGGHVPEWVDHDGGDTAVPVVCAPWREQGVPEGADEALARAKVQRAVEMALARVRQARRPQLVNVTARRRVAVIGGNHAAWQAVEALLEGGLEVLLIASEPPRGCFYPLDEQLVGRLSSRPEVEVIDRAELSALTGCLGAYRLLLHTPRGARTEMVGALVVAVDAQTEPLEDLAGLPAGELVLSLRDYVQACRRGEKVADKVCIWLDRDGLDRSCAGRAALEAARQHAARGGQPTLLCRQIPVYGRDGQLLYDQARQAGVTIIRYEQEPQFESNDAACLQVSVTDNVLPDRRLHLSVQRLVIPARVRPSALHARLAELLRQPLDIEGYLQPGNVRHRPVASARRGIYFIGGCHDQCHPGEAALEARAVLAGVRAQLADGKLRLPAERVVVDGDKCASCLTCYRECPHGAITPNTAQHRMDILDPACWQCGICTAVCPGRALEHGSLNLAQMRALLEVAGRDLQGQAPVVVFACRQSAVAAAEEANRLGLSLPAEVVLVDVPCAGLVSEQMILDAIERGARGVLVLGCHHDNCRSLWGSDLARKRLERLEASLQALGVGDKRVLYHSLAANEAHRLQHLLEQACQELADGRIGD